MDGLIIDTLGGLCPVQSTGMMCGLPYYFRARHDGWSLTIAAPGYEPVDVWVNTHLDGNVEGLIYHNAELHPNAGYMAIEVARGIIEAEYTKFSQVLSQPTAAAL